MNVFHTVKNITREILEFSNEVTGKKKREEKQPTLNAAEIFLFRFRQSPWYLTVSLNENGRW